MSKSPYPKILIGLLLIGISLACNMLSTQVPIVETETPLPTPSLAETATLSPPPTETLVPFTPTPEFAPVCEPDAASIPTPADCQLPIAEQSSIFCTNKIPYNLILINEGATYEVLSEGFQCTDAGINNGKKIVTCTGLMGSSFELKVCDPACAVPTVQAEITQCPQSYIYDNLRGCCTQELGPVDQNCMILNLATRSCVVNCNEITKEAACERNSYACEWDDNNDVCQLRQ